MHRREAGGFAIDGDQLNLCEADAGGVQAALQRVAEERPAPLEHVSPLVRERDQLDGPARDRRNTSRWSDAARGQRLYDRSRYPREFPSGTRVLGRRNTGLRGELRADYLEGFGLEALQAEPGFQRSSGDRIALRRRAQYRHCHAGMAQIDEQRGPARRPDRAAVECRHCQRLVDQLGIGKACDLGGVA